MSIVLPTKKIAPVSQDPRNLILFGVPKVGKTSIISCLDNCLILDFESGSDYVTALKIKVGSIKELQEVCKAIKEAGNPYKFIAMDTITAIEDFAKPLALKLYKATPQGSTFELNDVIKAPHGAGYGFLREAMEKIIAIVQSVCEHIILIGHVKDTVAGGDGDDASVKDLDLVGKTKRILASRSDAIGFVSRDENSNLCIDFSHGGEVACGARPPHLANKKIVVAERQEDDTFVSHWDRVYPSLENSGPDKVIYEDTDSKIDEEVKESAE